MKQIITKYCTRKHHWITFLLCLVCGIAGIILGFISGTAHNVFFGIMFIIIGRVLLTADVDVENPLKA